MKAKVAKFLLSSVLGMSVLSSAHYNVLANQAAVKSVVNENGKITLHFNDNTKMQIHFLKNDLFRIQKVNTEGKFVERIATPRGREDARIVVKDDSQYSGSEYQFNETQQEIIIENTELKLVISKELGTLKLTKPDGTIIFEEKQPIHIAENASIQTLNTNNDEYFYGGGTQNGRFSHKGNRIEIVNSNNWVDGGVASPNPFYWSTKGYGIVRNTYQPGYYDFGKQSSSTVINQHRDSRFDAYYFTGDTPQDLIKDYVTLTGNPAQLPDYAYYLAHLNCYNRDYWLETSSQSGRLIDGKYYQEYDPRNTTPPSGAVKETLMPEGNNETFTAKRQIDLHREHDIPLGWFLPNDGYGCGFGQDATSLDNNIQNLKKFIDYAQSVGVKVGLWTQSNLTPQGDNVILQRDFDKEVNVAGVKSLKTDVAWVGPGYTFGLNGLEQAAKVLDKGKEKHNVVTLDGWAGTQRYGGIWTGDQTGGQWEYIRFHIPTLIGTGLSGNPHIGSDMDGIFGGKNPVVQVRDFQYKAFAGYMLDMDGWGSSQKNPWEFGGKYTDINRAYLKLKAQLLPYTATESEKAHQSGEPILKAMLLEYPNAYTYSDATKYQYLWGSQFLVAPVYQNTNLQTDGSDIRNGIYLPNNNDGSSLIWIDYITGKQYRGGSVINNYDAPLWKLPVFVKNGSIIPMYKENNNPLPITNTNPKGLDRSVRIVEFYPHGLSEYTQYEDDGIIKNGPSISTTFKSEVNGENVVLKAEKATSNGDISHLAINKNTEFVVNVSQEPTNVIGKLNDANLTFTKVNSKAEYDAATGNVYFYNTQPESFITKYAKTDEIKNLNLGLKPKLYIKSTDKVNVLENVLEVTVQGFKNEDVLAKDELNLNLTVPSNLRQNNENTTSTQIKVEWDAVENAQSYDLLIDGVLHTNIKNNEFVHVDLKYSTNHTYKVRSRNQDGYSQFSDEVSFMTKDDPYRNVPEGIIITSNTQDHGSDPINKLSDRDENSMWHTHWTTGNNFKQLDVNLNGSYEMDRFEYLPRENAGNGNFLRGEVLVSRDGVHYQKVGDFNWNRDNSRKTFNLPQNLGRISHIRLANVTTVGGFGSGNEFIPYAKDPKRQYTTFDYNDDKEINDGEVTFLKNYAGLNSSDNDWGYVEIADVNYNGTIDATDISAVTRMLDGGTRYTPNESAEGKIKIIADKETAQAGDEVTFKVYGIGLDKVNAISTALTLDSTEYEEISIEPTLKTARMRNYSTIRQHTNKENVAYVLFANDGEKELVSRDGLLAKIKARVKKTVTINTNPKFALLTNRSLVDHDARLHDEELVESIVTESELSNTVITKVEARNPFTNGWIEPTELMQGGNYRNLYDGNTLTESEFKWYINANSFGDSVSLPTDFKFTLDTPKILSKFEVYNRNNLNGNGAIKSIKASYVSEDGSEHELATIDAKEKKYTFNLPANTRVSAIIVTPLTSNGVASAMNPSTNRMLTFAEVKLFTSPINATQIGFKNVSSTMRKDAITKLDVEILPENAQESLYEITSENPDIISIERFSEDGVYKYLANPLQKGEAKLIAKLKSNPAIKAEIIVTVDDSLVLSEFEKMIARVSDILSDAQLYDETQIEALTAKIESLESIEFTQQDDIDREILELEILLSSLQYKGSNKDILDSRSPVKVVTATQTSFAEAENDNAMNTIDNNPDTIWHSSYQTGMKLPQSVTLDLGSEKMISQINHLARQSNSNGHITQYRIEVSVDGTNFVPVVAGYFENNGTSLKQPSEKNVIKFTPTSTRYVKFIAEKSIGDRGQSNDKYASISELEVFEYEPAVTLNSEKVKVSAEEGVLPAGTTIKADYLGLQTIADKEVDLYNIGLYKGEEKVQPAQGKDVSVEIKFDTNKKVESVYYVENNQLTEKKEHQIVDGNVVFKTTHFSNYAVVYEKETKPVVNPGQDKPSDKPTVNPNQDKPTVKPIQDQKDSVDVSTIQSTDDTAKLSKVAKDVDTADYQIYYLFMSLISAFAMILMAKKHKK